MDKTKNGKVLQIDSIEESILKTVVKRADAT